MSIVFSMFSQAGDQKVAEMIAEVNEALSRRTDDGMMLSEAAAYDLLRKRIDDVERYYGEIADTEVRHAICYALDDAWERNYGHQVDQWELI